MPDQNTPIAEHEASESPPEHYDAEALARRDAALRHVRKLGDPVLRAKALPVEHFDAELKAEIERMGALMTDAFGVGLAATQVGILHRVFVYRAYADDEVSALVNPVIEHASEELEIGEEGCLSIPGVHVDVERPAEVRMRGQDADGNDVVVSASGLEARVLQHELDHLDGVLILDRISREQRREAMRAMRESAQGGGEQVRRRPLEPRDGPGHADGSSAPASDGDRDGADGQAAVAVESTRA